MMRKTAVSLVLVVAFLLLSSCSVRAFDLEVSPDRGPSEATPKPSAEGSLQLVESIPAGTTLDLESIPNTTAVWKDLLSSADESIHLGMYYFNGQDRKSLKPLTDLLERKAENGVRVNVLSDSVFFSKYPGFLRSFAQLDNTNVRILNLKDRTGGVMHAKYIVVDRRKFYLGSANFSWVSLKHNRELGIAGNDRTLSEDLLKLFETDWELGGRSNTDRWSRWDPLQPTESPRELLDDDRLLGTDRTTHQIVASPPSLTPESIPTNRGVILKLIRTARDTLFVDVFQYGLTSQYSPSILTEFDFALRRAALRGVRVNLLVSDWSLTYKQGRHLKSLAALPNVDVKYLRFPTHSDGYVPYSRVTHSKAMLVDDQFAWVGSANWKPGYFRRSRNVGLITNDPGLTDRLRTYYLTAWTSSYANTIGLKTQLDVPYHW